MKKFFLIVLFLVGLCCNAQASIIYEPEVVKLAAQVAANKDKFKLEYKSEADLLDTCSTIIKYTRYEPTFDRYDVASIVIKESKFNPRAYNKVEKVAGLTQITKPRKYWKDELFWYTNPYDKDQSIKACLVVLKTFHKEHKTKKLAIKRYNGSTEKSTRYMQSIMAIKYELRSTKI